MRANKFQHKLKAVLSSLLMLSMILISMPGTAQDSAPQSKSFSDKEVENFIEANNKAAEVQLKSQEKMLKAIEKENLEITRFNQILEAQQQPDQKVDASKKEMKSFNNAVESITKIQQNMEKEIRSVLEEEIGLSKYEEMALAYQTDPQFQERVHAMAEEE